MSPDTLACLIGLVAGLAFIAAVSVVGSYLSAGRRIDAARLARGTRRPLDGQAVGTLNRIGDN